MNVLMNRYNPATLNWETPLEELHDPRKPALIFLFSSLPTSNTNSIIRQLNDFYPCATLMGCSSAGEVYGEELVEDGLVIAVVQFKHTQFKLIDIPVNHSDQSKESGIQIAQALQAAEPSMKSPLSAIFILSEGIHINGSALAEGVNQSINSKVTVTGGLAGDGTNFASTWVIADNKTQARYISAVGFYSEKLQVCFGANDGLDTFGPKRLITKSEDNIIYEFDGKPALALYKKYLGDAADGLPATGIHFSLSITDTADSSDTKVRILKSINEENQSISLFASVTQGSYATLMHANIDHLLDGAENIGKQTALSCGDIKGDILNMVVSCVGRKIVLKQDTEEELELVKNPFPSNTQQIGFYSYGEFSPLKSGWCDLHNQTLTLTTLFEED